MDTVQSVTKLFDGIVSESSGYVKSKEAITRIIREWEIATTSSFTTWKVEKNFGEKGLFRSFVPSDPPASKSEVFPTVKR